MRAASVIALLAIGCGGSVDPAEPPAEHDAAPEADTAPIACEAPLTGDYVWTWEVRDGNCGPIATETRPAPNFNCSSTLKATESNGVCKLAGDVMCANGKTTLTCTQDGAGWKCDAAAIRTGCSGNYALTLSAAKM